MRSLTVLRWLAVSLAVVGFCIVEPVLAATPALLPGQSGQATMMTDVQMQQGGVLVGQVVTPENAPVIDTEVVLFSGGKKLAVGKTDKRGYFSFSTLRRGVYQVVAAKGYGAFRVWDAGAAPPSAQRGVLIVAGSDTVRGQHTLGQFLLNPWVLGAIVATAIAVPVALHNSRSPGS